MTAFDIYSAVGNIGEDILEESEIMPKKKVTKIVPLIAAAACFAVVAVGLSQVLRTDNIEQPVTDINKITATETTSETSAGTSPASGDTDIITEPPVESETTHTSSETAETSTETSVTVTEETTADNTVSKPIEEEEIAIVPKWEDMSDLEKYIYLDYEGNVYGITMEHFSESELTFLTNGKLYGFDENHPEDCEGPVQRYSNPCAFYKINNISPDYMIAVLTADGKYTGFKRERFWYDTLGEAVEGTGILKRNIIGDTVSISDDDARQTTYYTVPDLRQTVSELLSSAPDTAVHVNPPRDSGYVRYYIYSSGGERIMTVYATGYVHFGIGYFNLGEDTVSEFIDYIEQNASSVEAVPYDTGTGDGDTMPE